MKWYIEFPIVYVIVVVILYFMGRNTWEEASLFVSLIFGFIVAVAGYAGYNDYKKKQKMKSMSEEEKVKIQEKERKTNKIMIWIIIGLIIFCIVLFGIMILI